MKCANCGKEISESDSFCPYCGEQLTGISGQDTLNGQSDENKDMTFFGSYDDPDEYPDDDDNRTYIDGKGIRSRTGGASDDPTYLDSGRPGFRSAAGEDDRTYFDSSGLSDNIRRDNADYRDFAAGADINGAFSGAGGTQDHSYGYQDTQNLNERSNTVSQGPYTPASGFPGGYGYGYQSVSSGSAGSRNPDGTGSSSLKVILMAAVVILILAAVAAAFFIFRNRTPELDSMTYDELITNYDLSREDSDNIKTAYEDRVTISFEEDMSKGKSGYQATAVIYAPDMEEIYEKTTETDGILDRLERLTDDDLKKTRKAVVVDADSRELTQDSAEDLQAVVDQRYMPVDDYLDETQTEDSQAETQQNSGDSSGSDNSPDSSGSSNNSSSSQNRSDASSDSGSTSPSSSNNGYVIADSSSRVISASELTGLSKWQCCIARNEIYARHGRKFLRDDLQAYFNSCSWYTPSIEANSFSDSMLNSVERQNVATIKSYEQAHGYL